MAIEMGKTVIVEQIQDQVNINLTSIMKKQIAKHNGQKMISFCRKNYKYDPNFRLFAVSTHLNPKFNESITNHVTYVNFCLDLDSL